MEPEAKDPIDRFAQVAERFCSWGTQVDGDDGDSDLAFICQLLADLVAAGCSLGWEEGEPSKITCRPEETEAVKAKASKLPFRYYSEIFNNLVVPPEEPVTGNLVDDLADIYADIAPGLIAYRRGDRRQAALHWRFWFSVHWGEHATSALRATWSFLAEREGAPAREDD